MTDFPIELLEKWSPEEISESLRLWPDPFSSPDIPPRETLQKYRQEPARVEDGDLRNHIATRLDCQRALLALREETAEREVIRTGLRQLLAAKAEPKNPPEKKTKTGDSSLPKREETIPLEAGSIYTVKTGFQVWNGEGLQRGFNFNPPEVMVVSRAISRESGGEYYRVIPCSAALTWGFDDAESSGDILFRSTTGSEWILHTWLEYPVSSEDFAYGVGRINKDEQKRLKEFLLNRTASSGEPVEDPEWLLDRERLAVRASTLPCTCDARRMEALAGENKGEFCVVETPQEGGALLHFPLLVQDNKMAAADIDPQRSLGSSTFFLSETPEVEFTIREGQDPRSLAFEVDSPEADILEGSRIVSGEGETLATIKNGMAYFSFPASGLKIVDPQGQAVDIQLKV